MQNRRKLMNNKQEKNIVENSEDMENNTKSTSKSSTRFNLLIYLMCFLLALIIGFYMNFLEDPIMNKRITVRFVLVDGEQSDYITPMYGLYEFYGTQSDFDKIKGTITVEISKNEFIKDGEYCYDVPMQVDVQYMLEDYPGIHSHDHEKKEFTLTQKSEITTENDTSADK